MKTGAWLILGRRLVLSIGFILILCGSSHCLNCTFEAPKVNYYLKGHNFRSIDDLTIEQCKAECLDKHECKAIDYDRDKVALTKCGRGCRSDYYTKICEDSIVTGTTYTEATLTETHLPETILTETTLKKQTPEETALVKTTHTETTPAETTIVETTHTFAATNFAKTTFTETTLAGTTLAETTPAETTIVETTHTFAATNFAKTTFTETTLAGTTLAETTLAETSLAETTLAETTLAETTLAETSLAETSLAETSLAETSLAETSLAETSLAETSLAETTLAETTLAETSLAETTLAETTLAETTLAETSLAETSLAETSLAETTLAETSLAETSLAETSLKETTLAETSLAETSLAETTLAETTLEERDTLPDAILGQKTSSNFAGKYYSRTTESRTIFTELNTLTSTHADTTNIETTQTDTTLTEISEAETLSPVFPNNFLEWEVWTTWTVCYFKHRFERLRIRLCTVSESEATKRIGSACPLKLHANTTSGTRNSLVLQYASEREECIPDVDGIWTGWTYWSACSSSCDAGTKSRKRTCLGRSGSGRKCTGNANQNDFCVEVDCHPKDAVSRSRFVLRRREELLPTDVFTESDSYPSNICLSVSAIAILLVVLFILLSLDVITIYRHSCLMSGGSGLLFGAIQEPSQTRFEPDVTRICKEIVVADNDYNNRLAPSCVPLI
ncbi:hypothetical protein CAPTEDRAFT_204842 [Capitella teleta]|uniref:Apple domain-containing protein n=1 Tax=Capitella teleta TaxID=283909 RepID=R7TUV0_CAPTE|nr:hypothetical protein CAPTEDRAFT_204842 [Capitella teleta]|eukprot:ELT97327.1 hypothetical protein CAPTEDRAFT_204842 [Capitella teleta]